MSWDRHLSLSESISHYNNACYFSPSFHMFRAYMYIPKEEIAFLGVVPRYM